MNTTQVLGRWSVIALASFAAISFAGPALGEVTARAGTLKAQGSGEIWAYGQGQVRFHIVESGKLIVRHTDENQVTSSGYGPRVVAGATVTFVGYKGDVTIKGQKVAAYYDGGKAEFEATGDALVTLSGKGTYAANDAGAADWEDYGTTIVMGSPTVNEEDQVWGETAQYEAETTGAAQDIRAFPAYQDWAATYPDAATELVRSRDYYFWCSTYPTAVAALYNHPRWGVWITARPRLVAFVEYHSVFFVWYDEHPIFRPYFRHPVFYHAFIHRYPRAFVNVTIQVTFRDWCDRNPVAFRTLETNAAIQNRLLANQNTRDGKRVDAPNVHAIFQNQPARPDKDVRKDDKNRTATTDLGNAGRGDDRLAGDVRHLLNKKDDGKAPKIDNMPARRPADVKTDAAIENRDVNPFRWLQNPKADQKDAQELEKQRQKDAERGVKQDAQVQRDADKRAEQAQRDAEKRAEQAQRDAEKRAADQRANDALRAAQDRAARDAATRAQDDALRAARDAQKAQEQAARDAEKRAEQAQRDTEKRAADQRADDALRAAQDRAAHDAARAQDDALRAARDAQKAQDQAIRDAQKAQDQLDKDRVKDGKRSDDGSGLGDQSQPTDRSGGKDKGDKGDKRPRG